MHNEDDTADTLGLHFFGNMTASISHEIKNALVAGKTCLIDTDNTALVVRVPTVDTYEVVVLE